MRGRGSDRRCSRRQRRPLPAVIENGEAYIDAATTCPRAGGLHPGGAGRQGLQLAMIVFSPDGKSLFVSLVHRGGCLYNATAALGQIWDTRHRKTDQSAHGRHARIPFTLPPAIVLTYTRRRLALVRDCRDGERGGSRRSCRRWSRRPDASGRSSRCSSTRSTTRSACGRSRRRRSRSRSGRTDKQRHDDGERSSTADARELDAFWSGGCGRMGESPSRWPRVRGDGN